MHNVHSAVCECDVRCDEWCVIHEAICVKYVRREEGGGNLKVHGEKQGEKTQS